MDTLDPVTEWQRLAQHYREMSDGELIVLAQKNWELTTVAQQALAHEVSSRGLEVPSEQPKRPEPPPPPSEGDDSPYKEERTLVAICKVWSLRDALQLQGLLDAAAIPFYIGPERATGVDTVTSNFSKGLDVQIMQVGWPWARGAMQRYEPLDQPAEEAVNSSIEMAIHCPKCQSTEVVFEELCRPKDEDSAPRFKWTCNACWNEWEDEGVVSAG